MRRLSFALVLVLIAVAGTACLNRVTPTDTAQQPQQPQPVPTATLRPTDTPQPTQPTPTPTPPEDKAPALSTDKIAADIVDVVWQWAELHEPDGQSVVADPENYVLVFHPDGTFAIEADCNTGNGTYTLDGNRLTFGPIAITQAQCPPGSLSDAFTRLLGRVDTAAIENTRLVLTLQDGAGKMIFDNAEMANVPPRPEDWIIDVLWMWESFADQSEENDIVVDDPSKYTLQLLHDGTYRFKADCNVGSGSYTLSGSSLTLEPGPTTLAECGPGSLYNEYLDNLGHVASYVLNEGKLVLNLIADAGNMVFGREGTIATGPRIDPSSVTLDTMGLPYSWQANLVAATPYDASQPPGPMGLPEHIQVNFGVVDPKDKQPGDPVIYIIPVEPYKELWERNGDSAVSVMVDVMLEMLQDRPESFPTAGIPVLPFEEIGGTNDLAVQGKYMELGTTRGLRFVGRFVQDPNPVTNEGLRYILWGFSGGASEFLIVFFYPVTTPALPRSSGDVPAAELDRLNADIEAYLQERAGVLNGLSESDWDPSLSMLDAVLASLRFKAQ